MKRVLLSAFACITLLPLQTPAMAQSDAEATYLRYQTAVAAAERCRKVSLDQDQHQAIADYIVAQLDGRVGPGRRLTLISDAEVAMRGAGCKSDDAAAALALYDTELAPLLAP